MRDIKRTILAVLASSPEDHEFTPVQVQKLFFLVDQNVASAVNGPLFNFEPYHYGPFDKAVYLELEKLSQTGDIEVYQNWQNGLNTYRLTAQGRIKGTQELADYNLGIRQYLSDAVDFVTRLSFTELVAAIYRAYPRMKDNSIFNDE
jgi:uncharacterized protein YwgA